MFKLKTKDMAPKYVFKDVEEGKYNYWVKNGFFTSGDQSKIPYTIVIPPPNVTGKLHIGHAWDTTLQDIIIRRKRMQGYDALWIPGMDHAGIATQAKVDAKLKTQGVSRYDLGREKFLEVVWDWKHEYAEFIRKQWAVLGLSLDYTKERFTLDEGLQEAVKTVFVRLYNEGLIYRGERIINWDVEAKTALSNIEVEYKEIEGAFYHILYPFVDEDGGLEIATTRPETMFGDVALMVNPNDERYQKYIGKNVYIPGTNRIIPIISDEYVDMEFGTGVVKVTPAHDPNDFEVGTRHHLDCIICMNEDGTMNEYAGKYQGMDRFKCRDEVVNYLQQHGLCTKIEKLVHSVGHSERTGVIVEPRLSKQWFVKMEPLAKDVLDMQASCEAIEFIPPRFSKTLETWLDLNNIQDWCISRQLWWGHRIPAWYKGEQVYVGMSEPIGDGWVQDEDVLDTWFSSALWPFSTLGWPKKTSDLQRYFPLDCLVTGYDIIFFWVARMAIDAKHFMKQRPFKKCLIHGLIRDDQGRKMSKSLGNVVDPFDIVDQYGCDALRYFLTTNSTPGQDLRFSDEKMASSWNYINKIWNISRFVKMNLINNNYQGEQIDFQNLTALDSWILSKMNALITYVDSKYESFEFGEVARAIYNFTWDDFASWYLEMTKVDFIKTEQERKINTCAVLTKVLITIVKLLHPFMPFVTEEIFQNFYDSSITISEWPKVVDCSFNQTIINETSKLFEIITTVRNIRSEMNVPMSKTINISLETNDDALKKFLLAHQEYLKKFTNFDQLVIAKTIDKTDAIVKVIENINVVILLKELIDIDEEIAKLKLKYEKLEKEVARSENMLNNQNFILKAPTSKITEEKNKLASYQEQLKEVKELLLELEK